MRKLEGKSALVTGSGRGIGRSIALKLATEGANVVVNDLDDEPAQAVVEEIRSAGGQAIAYPGNVTGEGFAEGFVQTAVKNYDGVDIIINNAGYTWDNVIQKMADDQWHEIVNLHLKAPFDLLRAAQPVISAAVKNERIEKRVVHRKVVNISSIAGVYGNVGQANYASAKAGVIGLTKAMAKEWGRYNVNVNCVAFGLIETRLGEASAAADASINIGGRKIKVGVNPELLKRLEEATPLGRPGTPEEAAGSVVMLTYPEADYVTGQLIVTAGGFEG